MKTKGAKALGKRVAEVSAKNGAKLDLANRRALEMSAWSTLAGVAEPGAPPASPPLSGRRPSCRARVLLAFSRWVIKPMLPLVVDLIEAQDLMAKMDRWFGGGKDNSARLSVNANGVPAEWIIPGGNSESPRVILYLHGGGFMFNTPRLHARLAARLSQALGAKALLPDYRLAPDHPLPAAHEDCLTAYRWLLDNGHAASDIVIMGDSAGGMLTLATLQRIRDAGLPLPVCGVMFSPGTCVDSIRELDASAASGDPLLSAGMIGLLQRVVVSQVSAADPAVSPCAGSLHGLPPLLFQAGSTEALLHQSTKAHAMAQAAGTTSELQVWPRMPHVWHAVRWLPEAHHALDCVADFIARHAQARRVTSADPGLGRSR